MPRLRKFPGRSECCGYFLECSLPTCSGLYLSGVLRPGICTAFLLQWILYSVVRSWEPWAAATWYMALRGFCLCAFVVFFEARIFIWAIILHRGVCGDTLQPITFVFRRSLRHVFAHAEWLTPDVNLVRGGCFCIGNLHVPRGHAGRCLACRCSSCLPMVGS